MGVTGGETPVVSVVYIQHPRGGGGGSQSIQSIQSILSYVDCRAFAIILHSLERVSRIN